MSVFSFSSLHIFYIDSFFLFICCFSFPYSLALLQVIVVNVSPFHYFFPCLTHFHPFLVFFYFIYTALRPSHLSTRSLFHFISCSPLSFFFFIFMFLSRIMFSRSPLANAPLFISSYSFPTNTEFRYFFFLLPCTFCLPLFCLHDLPFLFDYDTFLFLFFCVCVCVCVWFLQFTFLPRHYSFFSFFFQLFFFGFIFWAFFYWFILSRLHFYRASFAVILLPL